MTAGIFLHNFMKKGGSKMKKLNKIRVQKANTVEVFAAKAYCSCVATCACGGGYNDGAQDVALYRAVDNK